MKTVVLLSGGVDSTTLLHLCADAGDDLACLFVRYGQRHDEAELACASYQIETINPSPRWVVVEQDIKDLTDSSTLTNSNLPIPRGHYANDNMRLTVVPNRNMLLLSLTGCFALNLRANGWGTNRIAYAAHSGDHPVYPDCQPAFGEAMNDALRYVSEGSVELYIPFLSLAKADIIRLGSKLGVDYSNTWSCYDPQTWRGRVVHCGECGTCVERREAFALAGVNDPTVYAPEARDLQTLLNTRMPL